MRKLMQICRQEEFNQRTFYKWLQEAGYIEKSEAGYVTAKSAPDGMENLTYSFTYADGTVQERSQVTASDELAPIIIAAYLTSDNERLYSTRAQKSRDTKKRDAEPLEQQRDDLEVAMKDIKENVNEIKQMLTKVLS